MANSGILYRQRLIDERKARLTDDKRKYLAWVWLSICLFGFGDESFEGHY